MAITLFKLGGATPITTYTDAVGQIVSFRAESSTGLINTIVSSDTSKAVISEGTAAPTTTPARVGLIFIDKAAGKVYISKGIASSADWIPLN